MTESWVPSERENRGGVSSIVLTSPYPLVRLTGIGRFVQDLARFLEVEGIRSAVVCPAGSESTVSRTDGGISLQWRIFPSLELAIATAARLIHTRSSFQVVHVQQAHLQSLLALLVGRILGKRAVLTIHVRTPVSPGRLRGIAHRFIAELSLRAASVPVAVSPFVAETFHSNRVIVIENGVDTSFFHHSVDGRRKIRARLDLGSETTFVFAGRWTSTKGIGVLLDAADSNLLDGLPFKLVLLGEAPPDEPHFMQQRLQRIVHRSRIVLAGSVAHELPDYLSAGDVFAAPSPYEGMPLAFLEAMATGLPPLASDIPVHRLLVERSGVGWLFPSGDAQELAALMAKIIDRGIPAQVHEQARAMVLRHNDVRAKVADYIALYDGISAAVEARPAPT